MSESKNEKTTKAEESKPVESPAPEKSRGFFAKTLFWVVYLVFLGAVVFGCLAGVEYYAYLKIKKSPAGAPYVGKDMSRARESSQKVAPAFGYEPTPGFASVRNTRLGNSFEYMNGQSSRTSGTSRWKSRKMSSESSLRAVRWSTGEGLFHRRTSSWISMRSPFAGRFRT